jgi:Rrf2 family protein
MKVSTRGRYAIRALLCLGNEYGNGPISLKKISKIQKISVKYLENIMRLFVNERIVSSMKGKNGGFELAINPRKIKMGEVIRIAEGDTFILCCLPENSDCPNNDMCATREMWVGLNDAIIEYLDSFTLQKLLERYKYLAKKFGKTELPI